MVWTVEFSEDATRDFELIFDHLFSSYQHLGTPPEEAFAQAAIRIEKIQQTGLDLAKTPHRGTLREDISPGLRNVTLDRAVYWFELDNNKNTLRILAIFFGGQDHIRHMLTRLLQ